MNPRTLLLKYSYRAAGCTLSGKASFAIDSRSRRKPEREGKGALIQRVFRLALGIFLLSNSGFAQIGLARTNTRIDKLTAWYSINESVNVSDGVQIRNKLLKLLSRANVGLFLAVIKKAEAGEPYLMVGGCRATTLKLHPALTLPSTCWYRVPRWGYSTASGNYQITYSNWKKIASFLGLRDFSETSQALAALELIRRGGGAANASTPKGLAMKQRIQDGFVALLRGNLKSALCLATYDWASSTCSPFPANHKFKYVKLVEIVRKIRIATHRNGSTQLSSDTSKRTRLIPKIRKKHSRHGA